MVFLFDLSQTLLVGGGLLVLCSLLRPPIVKQLMPEWSLSVSVLLLTQIPVLWVAIVGRQGKIRRY